MEIETFSPELIDDTTKEYKFLSEQFKKFIYDSETKLIGLRGEKGIGKSSFIKTLFKKDSYIKHMNHVIIEFNYNDIVNDEFGIIKLYNQIIYQLENKIEYDIANENSSKIKQIVNKFKNKIKRRFSRMTVNGEFNFKFVKLSIGNQDNEYLTKLKIEHGYLEIIRKIVEHQKIKCIVFEDFDVINYTLLSFINQLKLILDDCTIIVPINHNDLVKKDNQDILINLEKIFDIILPMYNANDVSAKFIDLFGYFCELLSNEYIQDGLRKQEQLLLEFLKTSKIFKLDNRKIINLKNMISFKKEYNQKNDPVALIYYSIAEIVEINKDCLFDNETDKKEFEQLSKYIIISSKEMCSQFSVSYKNEQWRKLLENDDFYADINDEDTLENDFATTTLRSLKKITQYQVFKIERDEKSRNEFIEDIKKRYYPEKELIKMIENEYVSDTTLTRTFNDGLMTFKFDDDLGYLIQQNYDFGFNDFNSNVTEGWLFIARYTDLDKLEQKIDEFIRINRFFVPHDYSDVVAILDEVLQNYLPDEKSKCIEELKDYFYAKTTEHYT